MSLFSDGYSGGNVFYQLEENSSQQFFLSRDFSRFRSDFLKDVKGYRLDKDLIKYYQYCSKVISGPLLDSSREIMTDERNFISYYISSVRYSYKGDFFLKEKNFPFLRLIRLADLYASRAYTCKRKEYAYISLWLIRIFFYARYGASQIYLNQWNEILLDAFDEGFDKYLKSIRYYAFNLTFSKFRSIEFRRKEGTFLDEESFKLFQENQEDYPDMYLKVKELLSQPYRTKIPIPYCYWNLIPEKFLIHWKPLEKNEDILESLRPRNIEFSAESVEKSKCRFKEFLSDLKPKLLLPSDIEMATWVNDSVLITQDLKSHTDRDYRYQLALRNEYPKMATRFKFVNRIVDVSPANSRSTYIGDMDTRFTCKKFNWILANILKQLRHNVIAASSGKFSRETEFLKDPKNERIFFETDLKKNGISLPSECILAVCEALDEHFNHNEVNFTSYAKLFREKSIFSEYHLTDIYPDRGTGLGNSNELETLIHLMVGLRTNHEFVCLNDDVAYELGYHQDFPSYDDIIAERDKIIMLYKQHNFIINPAKTLVGSRVRFCEVYYNTEQISKEFSKNILYILPLGDSIIQGHPYRSKTFLQSLNSNFGHLGMSEIYTSFLPLIIERVGLEFGTGEELLYPEEFGGWISIRYSDHSPTLINLSQEKNDRIVKHVSHFDKSTFDKFNRPIKYVLKRKKIAPFPLKDYHAYLDEREIRRFSKRLYSFFEENSIDSLVDNRKSLFSIKSTHNSKPDVIISAFQSESRKRNRILTSIRSKDLNPWQYIDKNLYAVLNTIEISDRNYEVPLCLTLQSNDRHKAMKKRSDITFSKKYIPSLDIKRDRTSELYLFLKESLKMSIDINFDINTENIFSFLPTEYDKTIIFRGQPHKIYVFGHTSEFDVRFWSSFSDNWRAVREIFFLRYGFMPKNLSCYFRSRNLDNHILFEEELSNLEIDFSFSSNEDQERYGRREKIYFPHICKGVIINNSLKDFILRHDIMGKKRKVMEDQMISHENRVFEDLQMFKEGLRDYTQTEVALINTYVLSFGKEHINSERKRKSEFFQ